MKVLVCLFVVVAGALGAAPGIPSGRLIGGHDAARNQFPFQASVQFCINANTCQHTCGGVIVSPTAVISAAHCVTGAPTMGSYRILVGVLNLNDDNPEREFVRVSHVLVHPNYKGGINPDDIAIFKLHEPLILNEAVHVAFLSPLNDQVNGPVVVTGWGAIAGGEIPVMPTTLQIIDTQIINATACRAALDTVLGGAPHPFDDDTNLCTGPLTGGVSICTGDSGGPLIHRRFEGSNEVIGISSWGIIPCGTVGAPSIYVKLYSYLPWIRSHMFD